MSDYCIVVAVAHPASVQPLTEMGWTVETLVGLTGKHDVTVLGATEDSTLTQLLSGTILAGLAKRSQNTLLLVNNS